MQQETRSRKQGKTRHGGSASETPLDVFSLLKTNHITQPHERPIIEASIETYRRAIESAEEEIRRLEKEQATYESIIKLHHNLLLSSPVRSLPPEILSVIFAAYCDMNPLPVSLELSWVSCPVHTFLQSRMHLLGICRRWREVALSTPRLWNKFAIIGKGAELNQRWLAFAGTLPLELSYRMDSNGHAQQLFSTYLPRCEKLHLHILGYSDVDTLYRIPRASRLTTLTLKFPFWTDDRLEHQTWTESLLQNLPALTSLTTNASPRVVSPLATQLSQLILVDHIIAMDVLPYLRVLKRLRSIHLRLYTVDDFVPVQLEPVTHEHLELLTLKYANPFRDDQHQILLNHLILPRLQHLDLKPSTFRPEPLMKFFERSSCEISSLSLDLRWPPYRQSRFPDLSRARFQPDLSRAEMEDGLGECLKSPQVGKHLKKFCCIAREIDDIRDKVPDSLLGSLSEPTGHFPKLTELHFSSSFKQVPQILELLRNRATNYKESGVTQLKLLELQFMDGCYGRPSLSEHDIVTLRKTGTTVEMRKCTGEA